MARMLTWVPGGWDDYGGSDIGYVIEIGGRPQDTFGYSAGAAASIAVSKLLVNDTDADNDALTVQSVSATSADGAVVTLSGTTITYDPTHATTVAVFVSWPDDNGYFQLHGV